MQKVFSKNFIPVFVDGGRKFKGFGYNVAEILGTNQMTYCSPNRIKIWDPKNKKIEIVTAVYVHEVEKNEMPNEEIIKLHFKDYANYTINKTLDWTRTKTNSEKEARKFARACLIKYHFDMLEDIDRIIPDERDVVEEIEKALTFAINWRHYKTNKPAKPAKQARLAAEYLIKYRLYRLDGFKEAWEMLTNLRSLPCENIKFPNPDGTWPEN